MNKRFNRTFELTDGEITRECYFKIPDAETGLELLDYCKDSLTGEQAKGFAALAARHLVLLPYENMKNEKEIRSFDELTYIFNDPFIGLQLITQFQEDIAPLLKRSMASLRASGVEAQQQGRRKSMGA